jgi:Polyphosphate kinase C-terminal domain 2
VTAKMNGLDDNLLVQKLYQASQAGVRVELIVRGICRIRPGVPGVSDNVRVISIVGRFLEHHRIVRFSNGGDPRFFIGSADWMSRNLTRRVEVCTPITNELLKAQLQSVLDACLMDGALAWDMLPDGRYCKPSTRSTEHVPYGDDRLGKRARQIGLHSALIEVRPWNVCTGVLLQLLLTCASHAIALLRLRVTAAMREGNHPGCHDGPASGARVTQLTFTCFAFSRQPRRRSRTRKSRTGLMSCSSSSRARKSSAVRCRKQTSPTPPCCDVAITDAASNLGLLISFERRLASRIPDSRTPCCLPTAQLSRRSPVWRRSPCRA